MASEFLWSLPHVSPPMEIPELRHSPSSNCDDIFSTFDINETSANLQRLDTLNSPFTPFLEDDASDAFHPTPADPRISPVPSRYTKYDGQVKCIDWAYEAKLHPPVPVVPVSPSSMLARVSRARYRKYQKIAQSGIPIPSTSIDKDGPWKPRRKLSFPFSLKKPVKKVDESPSPPITPEQPPSSISARIRKTVNVKGTSFVPSPSSPKTPTGRGHPRMCSKHSISPRLFRLKNEQFSFGVSVQENMEPLLPVVEVIYSDLQENRTSPMSGLSSKRKREDGRDAGIESRPVSRVRVEP